MKYLLIFFIFALSVGCNLKTPVRDANSGSDSKYVSEIRLKAARNLREEYQLMPCGTGSQMMDKVKMIALSFNYYNPVDEVKGRELLIAATDELIQCVNDDERIRPYLHNYPFGPENVEIMIFVYQKNGSVPPPGKLIVLTSLGGVFTYKIDGPVRPGPTVIVQEETYKEATAKQMINK